MIPALIFLFLHLQGLQDPNSVFQVSLVPALKLPVGTCLGLLFVVVDAFAPVASSLEIRITAAVAHFVDTKCDVTLLEDEMSSSKLEII